MFGIKGRSTLGFDMHAYDLWCKLHGSYGLLSDIIDCLNRWAKGLDPTGKGRDVYTVEDGRRSMWLLGGALAVLLREEIFDLGSVSAWPEVGPSLEDLEWGILRVIRRYQADAVLAALTAPLGRSIIEVPTGGGKTFIAAALAAMGSATGMFRWLYLVSNTELAAQTDRTMRKVLPEMARCLKAPVAEVTCTTYARSERLAADWDGVIVDEAHQISPRTRSVPYSRLRCRWRVGLSGTPLDRQDAGNALTIGLLGPVVYKIGLDVLEREGHLARGVVQPVIYDDRLGSVKY